MNTNHALAALAASWLALAPASARAQALTPRDFAWGRSVETTRGDPLQTLLLDLPIYRGALGPEFADLRVFNGAGEVVPHAIRALVDPHEQEGALVDVPLFRVPEGSALVPRAGAGHHTERVRDVAIEIAADGAIVRVGPEAAAGERGPQRPSAYLVDLSRLPRAVVGLDLTLAEEPAEFAAALRIEASDDLEHFTALDPHTVLARLDQAGHRIERNRVELPSVERRYMLLSAPEPLPVEVTAVRARLAPVIEAPPRQRERIAGTRSARDRAEFVFDLGGAIPVDRVQVDLPVANTVVEAELSSAADPDGPWLQHFAGVLYQLERPEGALRNPEVAVLPIRQRYFKLNVSQKGGGIGGGAPALEVAWVPEQLVFVARGAGPFALGYGRAQCEAARFDAAELIRSALPPNADPVRDVPRTTARLGAVQAVGDPSVLEPRRAPTPLRTLALWGVLVASVAVVLALCVRLVRRIEPPG